MTETVQHTDCTSIEMEHQIKCQICEKTFIQKSSLTRHSKKCSTEPAPSLRQKSCRQCTRAKTKCDLRHPQCSRCTKRETHCEYYVSTTRRTRTASSTEVNIDANERHSVSLDPTPSACIAPVNFAEGPTLSSASLDLDISGSLFGIDLTDSLNVDPMVANFSHDANPSARTPASLMWTFPQDPHISFGPELTQHNLEPYESSIRSTRTLVHEAEPGLNMSNRSHDNWYLWHPDPNSTTPPLVKHSMETLLRVMKTWPKMLAKGLQAPPMMHFTHVSSENQCKPLMNCVTLVKMWANQGDSASEMTRQVVIQEMRSLFQSYETADELYLLSAIQALVVYIIILMFPGKNQSAVCLVDPAIFLCLQKVVSFVARTGLMAPEETEGKRPTWEIWIHITAKRRAVFCLYLLHWSYSVYHGLESFACSDLAFMAAPAPKFLWQAESKEKWQPLYEQWLAHWGDCPYIMREFSSVEAGTSLDERTEAWLEDTDELGIMFFSIVNATDRGEPRFGYGHGISISTME